MGSNPPFSSPAGGGFAALAESMRHATLTAATQFGHDSTTGSTPTTESEEVVTKKTEDPWLVDGEGNKVGKAEYSPGVSLVTDRDFLTVTLKAGTGFDAPWLVFHANSVDEALEALQHDKLEELMDLTARKGKELAKAFGGSQSAAKPSGGGGWGNKAKEAKKASSGAVEETDDGYECEHGPAVERSGKTGNRKWTGHFCPAPRGDNQCTPAFE